MLANTLFIKCKCVFKKITTTSIDYYMCVCVWCARFPKIDWYGCPLYYAWRCKTVNINSVDLNLCGSR